MTAANGSNGANQAISEPHDYEVSVRQPQQIQNSCLVLVPRTFSLLHRSYTSMAWNVTTLLDIIMQAVPARDDATLFVIVNDAQRDLVAAKDLQILQDAVRSHVSRISLLGYHNKTRGMTDITDLYIGDSGAHVYVLTREFINAVFNDYWRIQDTLPALAEAWNVALSNYAGLRTPLGGLDQYRSQLGRGISCDYSEVLLVRLYEDADTHKLLQVTAYHTIGNE